MPAGSSNSWSKLVIPCRSAAGSRFWKLATPPPRHPVQQPPASQRPRQPPLVALHRIRRAAAGRCARHPAAQPTTGAGVHRRHQQQPAGKPRLACGPRNGHMPHLQGFAQRFQRAHHRRLAENAGAGKAFAQAHNARIGIHHPKAAGRRGDHEQPAIVRAQIQRRLNGLSGIRRPPHALSGRPRRPVRSAHLNPFLTCGPLKYAARGHAFAFRHSSCAM